MNHSAIHNAVKAEANVPAAGLEPQAVSVDVLLEKYAKGAERTIEDVQRRVARGLASVEPKDREFWEEAFFQGMQQGIVPAGRIMSAAGTEIGATWINCFVQPIGDSVSGSCDGKPGIYDALQQAAETLRRGGGTGYNFSHLRPRGAKVRGTSSRASGPISYMRVYDRSCETVESAGARRGAQMGILNVDHPDILDFITAKSERGELKNFNVSVGVTDAFMHALLREDDWELVHAAEPADDLKAAGAYQRDDGLWVYRVVKAQEIWEAIMQNTYSHAEPGVIFLDRINEENPLWYLEKIEATNPYLTCGPPAETWCGKPALIDVEARARATWGNRRECRGLRD